MLLLLPKRALATLALGLLCGAGASCGGSGTTVRTAPPGAAGTGTTTVRYRGALVDVPAGWPVYDLDTDPGRCARLDVHAVYLGHQGADASCPAHLLGKTEAVQIEPLDGTTTARLDPAAAGARQINGQAAEVQPGSAASHDLVVSYPALGVVVTASFDRDAAQAQGVVGSVRAATP